jgi:hypothetical protein
MYLSWMDKVSLRFNSELGSHRVTGLVLISVRVGEKHGKKCEDQ